LERYNTGIVAAPGKRANMEDCFIINHDLKLHPSLPISVYSVLDGHGGEWCAVFLRKHFEAEIKKNLLDPVYGIFGSERKGLSEVVNKALTKSFKDLDQKYHLFNPDQSIRCGSTCVLVLIIGAHIFCASVGDSRAVLCRKGKAVNLSLDHKASRPDEVERIKRQQGQIEFSRVGGKLAITRAFGDFNFKYDKDAEGNRTTPNDIITSCPEIRRYDYDPTKDEFIILASDGLFDMFKSQEAVNFVKEKMKTKKIMG
jgi:serine/threonine protein phosphatase PrpC